MHIKYRLGASILLCGAALLCASYTYADLRGEKSPPPPPAASEAPLSLSLYARDGYVAVLDPALEAGAVITDIELSTLRETDRQLIEAGLPVDSREALLRLLEDLGS